MGRRAVTVLLFALVASSAVWAQSVAIEQHVTVLSSADVDRPLLKQRVGSCLKELLRQWRLTDKKLPNVVVFHASKKAAAPAFVSDKVSVRKNRVAGEDSEYYELWIVGEPNVRAVVVALENILETHFALDVNDAERNSVMTRVIRIEDATVGVTEGK